MSLGLSKVKGYKSLLRLSNYISRARIPEYISLSMYPGFWIQIKLLGLEVYIFNFETNFLFMEGFWSKKLYTRVRLGRL